jgi:hypothetical protein
VCLPSKCPASNSLKQSKAGRDWKCQCSSSFLLVPCFFFVGLLVGKTRLPEAQSVSPCVADEIWLSIPRVGKPRLSQLSLQENKVAIVYCRTVLQGDSRTNRPAHHWSHGKGCGRLLSNQGWSFVPPTLHLVRSSCVSLMFSFVILDTQALRSLVCHIYNAGKGGGILSIAMALQLTQQPNFSSHRAALAVGAAGS